MSSYLYAQSEPSRKFLYYMERISGRQQFEGVIDKARVYSVLSEIFERQGDRELSINHLQAALAWSPFEDLDVTNFFKLAQRFSEQERYADAQSIVEAVRVPRQRLSSLSISRTERREPDVMACVINTRRTRYADSYQAGREIARHMELITLDDHQKPKKRFAEYKTDLAGYDGHLDDLETMYPAVADLMKPIELFAYSLSNVDVRHSLFVWEGSGSFGSDLTVLERVGQTEDPTLAFAVLQATPKEVRKCLLLAAIYLCGEDNKGRPILSELFKQAIASQRDWHRQIMATHIAAYIAEEALHQSIQVADIANTLAYNKAQMDVRLHLAWDDARFAIGIMLFLYDAVGRDELHTK